MKGTFTSSRKIDIWVFKYQNYHIFNEGIQTKGWGLSKDSLGEDINMFLDTTDDNEYYIVFIHKERGRADIEANVEIKWVVE